MKKFQIPPFYQSGFVAEIKNLRKEKDRVAQSALDGEQMPRHKLKRDFSPTRLDFGPVVIYLARHFGFCYGVENAIEISYKAIEENPDKKIYLLSQMIHNPQVNEDLQSRGLQFILDTEGNQLIDWEKITADDIVIIPAFGTTLEIESLLKEKNIPTQKYNTTCPFVERVWNRAEKLGKENHTIIIHGKNKHEETRATFSHSKKEAPSLVIRDMNEAILLGKIISGDLPVSDFEKLFSGKFSEGFNPEKDLQRIGVVNQTTMLATETQAIADYLKNVMLQKYGAENVKNHFADTRDTLCYATNDNQQATIGLLETEADFAIVIGGYNSSNTSHLVELLEQKFPTYFINGPAEFTNEIITHFDYPAKKVRQTDGFIPHKNQVSIILTSGASCPDSLIEKTIEKFVHFFANSAGFDQVLKKIG